MSYTITENFVKSFARNLYLRAAQTASLFDDCVRHEDSVVGRMQSFDRLGSGDTVEDNVRHGDTPIHDLVHDRRWAVMADYIFAPMIDDEDKLKMLIDPTSEYVERCVQAHNRRRDDVIIAALYGTVITGENFDGTATFPSGQQLASGSTGMTPAKARSSMQKLREADIPDTEEFYLACAPNQVYTDLMSFPEFTSNDYNMRMLMENSAAKFRWLGFTWIQTNRLPVNGSSERRCFAWAKSGVGLGVAKEKETNVVRRPDKKNNAQIISKQSLGACRVEDEKVVEIPCA